MNEPRRVFIALPIAEHARAEIAAIVDAVRRDEPERGGVRWVRLDGLHLTVRFLGPTPEPRIVELSSAIADVGRVVGPVPIRIAGAAAFPDRGRPRTLVLTIEHGAEAIGAVAAATNDALAQRGWPRDDRPYRPHLTLARADGAAAGPAVAAALRAATRNVAIDVVLDQLVLFESLTGRGPARYVPLATAPLLGRT